MLLKVMQVLTMLKSLILLIRNYKDTQSAFKNTLNGLLTELKDFKFVATLVLEFKKIQSNDKMQYSPFCSSSKAGTIVNESGIDNVFESIYSTIISNTKNLHVKTRFMLSDSNRIQTHNHLVCKQTLNHLAKLCLVWLNDSVFVYELHGWGFESCCFH